MYLGVQLRLSDEREGQRRARMARGPVVREEAEQAVALGAHEDRVGLRAAWGSGLGRGLGLRLGFGLWVRLGAA